MSHFVAYILQFQEIIVYKIPPGGGGGSIASLRSKTGSDSMGNVCMTVISCYCIHEMTHVKYVK